MIFKMIQSAKETAGPEATQQITQQAAAEEYKAKEKRESKLVDVAHEVMRKDKANLDGLVRIGLPNVNRQSLKGKVRKKVWDTVSEGFKFADSDIVEEITERIVDAAENDPFYKKLFAEKDI